MKVKYCGPALDYSGYGEANRHDIAALHSVGVDVTVELTRHCLELANFGPLTQLIHNLSQKQFEYKVKILHTTPNIYNQFIEPEKYHIGRVFWETDKLPAEFAKGINYCEEVWTGSEYNAEAIRKAGVKKPIFIIPEAIEIARHEYAPYRAENYSNGMFNFYSIFEWTERKNPLALLEAYWREFETTENVALTIKTYVDNFTDDKTNEIRVSITNLKKKLNLSRYAPLYLYRKLMDRGQVYRFHATYDCFVSAHRGEGWGIPQMEAMLVGNPVISTNCGGIHEHLMPGEAILIPCHPCQVANTRNTQWYKEDQNWAEADIFSLRAAMRWVYEHPEEAKKMGETGQEAVMRKFSVRAVGTKMLERLTEIEKQLAS